jgi:hypothetical protein
MERSHRPAGKEEAKSQGLAPMVACNLQDVGKALWECGDQPRKGTGYLEGGWRSSDEEKGKWLESCLGRGGGGGGEGSSHVAESEWIHPIPRDLSPLLGVSPFRIDCSDEVDAFDLSSRRRMIRT